MNQGAITLQAQDSSKKPRLEVPNAIIVDKQPGNKDGTVRKLSSTSTWKQDTGYRVKRECEKSGYVAPTHANTTPRNTSSTSPPPPPPYPRESIEEDENNMELCTAIYSQIGDVNIINIP